MRLFAAFLALFSLLSLVVKLGEMSMWFALFSAAFFAEDVISVRISKDSQAPNITRSTVR